MIEEIETQRVLLRPFRSEDADAAYLWFGEPSVMRYTPGGPDTSVEKTRVRLGGYQEHQALHGFSKWLVLERATGQLIGDAGLLVLRDQGWTDRGFRFAQSSWGRGFATEAAASWVSAAFGSLGLPRLGAFAHPENVASQRVLEKVGFRPQRRETVLGMPSIVFTIAPLG
jgi:[ribosomal protein S5]-alanine N-acetyltransferase